MNLNTAIEKQAVQLTSRALTPQQLVPYRMAPPPEPYSNRIKDLHLVDFRSDPRDWGVPFLAAFGMNYAVIAKQCGLTLGQVAYRMSKLNAGRPQEQRICARNYRNGSSPVAQMVIETVGRKVGRMIAPALSGQIAAESSVVNV